jgi:hypothetical protein
MENGKIPDALSNASQEAFNVSAAKGILALTTVYLGCMGKGVGGRVQ